MTVWLIGAATALTLIFAGAYIATLGRQVTQLRAVVHQLRLDVNQLSVATEFLYRALGYEPSPPEPARGRHRKAPR